MVLDINECVANTHDCAAEADCKNIEGSFICTCYDGYEGNGKTCQGAEILTLIAYMIKCLTSSMFSLVYLSRIVVSRNYFTIRRCD